MNRKDHYMEIEEPIGVAYSLSTEAETKAFHSHDYYEIFIFLNGDVDYYVEQSCYHLERGHLMVFNDRELHGLCNYGNLPYERMTFHLNPKLIQNLCTDKSNLLSCFQNRKFGVDNAIILSESQLNETLRIYQTLKDAIDNPCYGSDVITNAYLSILLVLVNKAFHENGKLQPMISNSLLSNILSYIDLSLSTDLSLDAIAKRFSIDRYYLCHIFKKQTGNTIYQYILLKKISLAKQYLSEGKSVTEVCALSGFNDYTNFIRTFKNITGISPGKYNSR